MSTGFSHLTHQTLPTIWLAVCIQALLEIALQESPNHVVQSKMPSVGDGHDATTTALCTMPNQQGSPTCNPGLPNVNEKRTRHADHNPWPWHVPIPVTCPKQSYPLQLLKPHESTATKAYLPLQHSQQLERQPVPYLGTYLVHLAQCWPVQVYAQSIARTLITAQANAPKYGSTMVNLSTTTK